MLETWPEKKLPIAGIFLDPQNPRIPEFDQPLEPRELIAELIEHDKVYDLARDIVNDGWSPLEFIIALKREPKGHIVLEGNRRIAALKVLKNPELAPQAWVNRFKLLAEKAILPKSVRAVIAPNREKAARLIMRRHTRGDIEQWTTLMKARYYQILAGSGLSPKDIADHFGGTASEAAGALRMSTLYNIIRKLDYPPEVRAKVLDPRTFAATNLERLLENVESRQLLGIEFEPDTGKVLGRGDRETIRKILTKVVSDIATEEIGSRDLNSKKEQVEYLKRIGAGVPSKSEGTFALSDLSASQAAPPTGRKPSSKRPTTKRPRLGVIPPGYKCGISDRRVVEVYDELRKLKMDPFFNTSGVMLRVLLELSADRYLQKTGQLNALLARHRQKGKPADWSPTLDQMLNELLVDPVFKLHPQAHKMLGKLTATQQTGILHAFVHNNYLPSPSEKDLTSLWELLEPLFDVLLQEPKQPSSPS